MIHVGHESGCCVKSLFLHRFYKIIITAASSCCCGYSTIYYNINYNSYTRFQKKIDKWENVYLKCKITLYTMYLPEFKTIHYLILFIFSNRRVNKITSGLLWTGACYSIPSSSPATAQNYKGF
jgi:hypothetical protein